MKKFMEPEMTVEALEVVDVIATSGIQGGSGDENVGGGGNLED